MLGHALVDGRQIEDAISTLLAEPRAEYLHAHYASPGCYAARVDRVWPRALRDIVPVLFLTSCI